jgi:aminopeptidase YwaD
MNHLSGIACCLLLTFAVQPVFAQSKSEKATIVRLKQDIGYLASDELEGRATGSEGERKAGDYLIKAYKKAGISYYKEQYRHDFKFVSGREIANTSQIRFSGNFMRIGKDAFPLPFTGFKKAVSEAG